MKHILNSIIPNRPEEGGEGGGGEGEDKIEMTQGQFDDAMNKRLKRQERTLTDKFDNQMDELNTTIDGLKVAAKVKPTDDNDVKNQINTAIEENNTKNQKLLDAETKKADDAVAEVATMKTKAVTSRKQTAVVNVLSNLNVVAPNDLWTILNSEGVIGVDDSGAVVPIDIRTGEPVLGDGAKTMELETYLKDYLKTKPYYVRSSTKRGSDTKGGNAHGGVEDSGDAPQSISDVMNSQAFKDKEREIVESGGQSHGGNTPEGM